MWDSNICQTALLGRMCAADQCWVAELPTLQLLCLLHSSASHHALLSLLNGFISGMDYRPSELQSVQIAVAHVSAHNDNA